VLVAMTGVGLYDVEWIAGLAVGAAAMGVVAFAAMKSRLQLRPARPDKANSGAGPSDRVNRI
ncbi:MAG: hypothetical protein HKP25_11790, partial [Marinicaulis sp.]|nr:hypothetical protein [Marinicaulis sp.]